MVQITARGLDSLANGPERITVSWLKQFPEFADFHAAKPQAAGLPVVLDIATLETTPDEQLAGTHQALMQWTKIHPLDLPLPNRTPTPR
jgi:restriction system protein